MKTFFLCLFVVCLWMVGTLAVLNSLLKKQAAPNISRVMYRLPQHGSEVEPLPPPIGCDPPANCIPPPDGVR
jgi:hypothetical protein